MLLRVPGIGFPCVRRVSVRQSAGTDEKKSVFQKFGLTCCVIGVQCPRLNGHYSSTERTLTMMKMIVVALGMAVMTATANTLPPTPEQAVAVVQD